MRRLLSVLVSATVGCATASGGPVPSDADKADTTLESGDALFPIDDASDDGDTAPTETGDTGLVDTGSPDSGTCGGVGQPCCGTTCAAGGYCYSSVCQANPTLVTSSPDGTYAGANCADLTVVHLAPSYFQKVVITGRPTAIAYRYYKKTSCGDTVAKLVPGGGVPLDATGVYVFTIENGVSDVGCTNANLGAYESWVVVDGIETGHIFNRVFSSGCASYATCASVTSVCPPGSA